MRTQADRDGAAFGRELERKDAEIERLQEAKRRALAIADERAKRACDLRAENRRMWTLLDLIMQRCNANGGEIDREIVAKIESVLEQNRNDDAR